MSHATTLDHSDIAEMRRRARRRAEWFARIRKLARIWHERYRTREELSRADARILRDCGISEAERFIEVNKPFWEA